VIRAQNFVTVEFVAQLCGGVRAQNMQALGSLCANFLGASSLRKIFGCHGSCAQHFVARRVCANFRGASWSLCAKSCGRKISERFECAQIFGA